MKRGVWVLILLVVVASAISAWLFLRKDPHTNALTARELATQRLGAYLAEKFPGHRALLISNPFTESDGTGRDILKMETAGIAGFKKGLGTKATLEAVAFPELKPEARTNPRAVFIDNETTTPLSYLVTEDAFDKLVAQHANCDVIVSLIGLPAKIDQVRSWREPKPRFALLLPDLRPIGDAPAVKQAVKGGKLPAFVLNKPGAPDSRSPLKRSGDEEFNKRFLLVTPENIDQTIEEYPQLFPGKPKE